MCEKNLQQTRVCHQVLELPSKVSRQTFSNCTDSLEQTPEIPNSFVYDQSGTTCPPPLLGDDYWYVGVFTN